MPDPPSDRVDSSPSRWDLPPSWRWHGLLAVPLVGYLWSTSFPGLAALFWGISVVVTLALGVGWLFWFVAWAEPGARGGIWRWAVAPAMVLVVVAVGFSGAPLQARFEVGRPQFDAVVDGLQPEGSFESWAELDVPSRIGTFQIVRGYQVGSNVILEESTGSFLNLAGFAYLPDGPDDRLGDGHFEAPSFRSLGDGWYSWTASW